jgi:hypothetical protein
VAVVAEGEELRGMVGAAVSPAVRSPLAIEHTFVYGSDMTDPDASQRLVLRTLLDAHPRLVGIDELTAKLAEVPRVREALAVLVDDGLATRLGDRVGVSRAAVRFAVLRPA